MRKYKVILFITIFLLVCWRPQPTTWYIGPAGSDGSGDGTSGNPWRTFYKAVTDPSVEDGDRVYAFNGTYNEAQQIPVPVNMSIEGQSMAGVIIESSYAGSGQPLFLLQTTNGWLGNYGNQTISYLTIDGNNTTSSAIAINYRSNVIVDHITARDCVTNGVIFYGMPLASWGGTSVFEPDRSMPDHWCSGNKLTNSIITNCSGPSDGANVRMGQQDGIEISGCTITQPIRGSGTNCGGIKFYAEGWSKNTNIHDNTVTVTLNPGNQFNFSLEMWYELGGCHYYNNVFQGGADFDCGGKGSSTYCVWFERNEVGYPTYQQYNHYSLNFEASFSDVIVEKNYIHHTKEGFYFSQIWPNQGQTGRDNHPYPTVLNNIRISDNLFVKLGRIHGSGDWEPVYGMFLGRGDPGDYGTNDVDNIYVYNNVFECTSTTAYSFYVVGIWLFNANLTVDNFQIKNNIFKGFKNGTAYSAPIFGTGLYGTTMDINSYYVQNNDFYDCGNSNQILLAYSYPNPTIYSGNITNNPNLTTLYKIDELSACYRTGTYVGLTTDYEGKYWANPPSIGAYEVLTDYEPPEPPPTLPNGLLKYNGRLLKYNSRLFKIE